MFNNNKRKAKAAALDMPAYKKVDDGFEPLPADTIPEDVRLQILEAIHRRKEASAMERESKALKAEANKILEPLLVAYEVDKIGGKQFGGVASMRVSSGSSIGDGKLREAMLNAGVDPDLIPGIIEEATKSWATDYVDVR